MHRYKYCIIIGSSRGLGAAMTEELLERGGVEVIGVARTGIKEIRGAHRWIASKRYRHIALDIAEPESVAALKEAAKGFGNDAICVIFNSAVVQADVRGITVEGAVSARINRVGVDGLTNCIEAFQDHLLKWGGVFVGISSFSALTPPVYEPRVAYPASKSYLDMTLRCLRVFWHGRCAVVTVHLGHLVDKTNSGTSFPAADYRTAAGKIITKISGDKIPDEINYPFLYCLAYRYFLSFVPDSVYFGISRLFLSKRTVK